MTKKKGLQSIKNPQYEISLSGRYCRIFGFIGILFSILIGYGALESLYKNGNRDLFLIRLYPAGAVAATSFALAALGTTAKQSKIQSYYLKVLVENSIINSEKFEETI